MIEIAIINDQTAVPVDEPRLRLAIEGVFRCAGRARATLSLAVVDDRTIHELNRRHLAHDYPTDVLSFLLDEAGGTLDGEIVVSGERAAATAPAYEWPSADELLLYVIHGALHLVGFDDSTPADAERMRREEAVHLASFGLEPHNRQLDAGPGSSRAPRSKRLTREGSST